LSKVEDYKDYVLVSGGGIVAYYSAKFLAAKGVKVLLIHSSQAFRESEFVYINGELDSTYSDAHGKGGLSKFWEFQLMQPSPCAFADRPWISTGVGLADKKLFEKEEVALQKDLQLHFFSNMRLPWGRRQNRKILLPVLSQFLSHERYFEIFNVENSPNIQVFNGFIVHSFKESSTLERMEVEVRDLEGRPTKILCKALVLAAGTIGNAKILNSTQAVYKKNLWPALGKMVQDHQIISLGAFRPKSRKSSRFAIPTFQKYGSTWKQKFQIANSARASAETPDFAIEVTPLISYPNFESGVAKFCGRLWNAFARWIFVNFALDLDHKHRSVQCEILTEDYYENRQELVFEKDKVFVRKVSTSTVDFGNVRELTIDALSKVGYEPWETTQFATRSAYHLMGSTPMGNSVLDSVVDLTGTLHGFSRVKILGLSTLSAVGFVNPTFAALVNARVFLQDLVINS